MQERALADRIGKPIPYAREMLQLHHRVFAQYWKWIRGVVDFAALHRHLFTIFGWRLHLADSNIRSWANFPSQGNCAEILRLACCLATERGISVCAPVHDALLIEAPLAELESAVAATQRAMAEASAGVLRGFELRTDAKLFQYPDRYSDPRGERMWTEVGRAVEGLKSSAAASVRHMHHAAVGTL